MKQATDNKTFEIPLEGGKRGRGRPTKTNALTPAERAKRYRDAKRAAAAPAAIKRDDTEVTKKAEWPDWGGEKQATINRLQQQLDLANAERDAAFKRAAELEAQLADLQRDLQNANTIGMIESDCREETADRLLELQRKFDLEHLARIDAETKLATVQSGNAPAKRNPLAAKVRGLTKEAKILEEIIAALTDQNDNLRTQLASGK
ncbi:MAG: hypothetical protein ACXWU9_08255 [Telluria sp.]